MRLILIGPPGVGKGTQSALLQTRLNLVPLSSGEIFRREMEAQTDLGRLAKRYIDHGELVPNGVTIEMMAKRLHDDTVRRKGFVLDGFPRTVRQAQALDELLGEMDLHLDHVVSIQVPEDLIVARLSGRIGCTRCGEIYHNHSKPPKRDGLCDKCNSPLFVRGDDQPDVIRQRLEVFRENTAPVIDYYDSLDQLLVVDGSVDPETTYQQILRGSQTE